MREEKEWFFVCCVIELRERIAHTCNTRFFYKKIIILAWVSVFLT